jgi:hypothetical protein
MARIGRIPGPSRPLLRRVGSGAAHLDALVSRNDLAVAYNVAGRPAEAIPLQEETLRLFVTTVGPDH